MSIYTAQLIPTDAFQWAEKFYKVKAGTGTVETGAALQAARLRADALMRVDSDERPSVLEAGEWKFDADHLKQVNRVIDEFLDNSARGQIRQLADRSRQEGQPPHSITGQWFTEEQYDRLRRLLDQTDVPDQLLVACYVWLEAHEFAQAAYLLSVSRTLPPPDFANFTQTAEEHAADLRFIEQYNGSEFAVIGPRRRCLGGYGRGTSTDGGSEARAVNDGTGLLCYHMPC